MITVDREKLLFTLSAGHSTYQIKVDENGIVLHTYYGKKIPPEDLSYRIQKRDRGFSPQFSDVKNDRTTSLDTLPQEYSSSGNGDFRLSSVTVENADGSWSSALRYRDYRIIQGKVSPDGLPAFRDDEGVETLELVLEDLHNRLHFHLFYSIYPDCDLITRFVRVTNEGEEAVSLLSLASICLDFPAQPMDWITFHGGHEKERNFLRTPLHKGIQSIGSIRGTSSHQHNPFVILAEPDCGETHGKCFGAMLVYSGNFQASAEVDQFDAIRLVMGIHPHHFRWLLSPGESFDSPEAALSFSDTGLETLTHSFHRAIRKHLISDPYAGRTKPVLLNSWEACYFDFDEEKLLRIAREARDLGIELFVLDDGWFGHRRDDRSSLGDWKENRDRFRQGLKGFSRKIHEMGMKSGLWVEPEMVSEESDFYRSHPGYVLQPDRERVYGRGQLVLDFGRKEVRDAIYEQIAARIEEGEFDYIKWDMNRSLDNVWSSALPASRQGEAFHRYVLGVYEFLDRLKRQFPFLLIEGCSGGGGRFDAGMLFYTPQIWTSDNTDPIDRLSIQHGTSFAYPISSMGAHVSASPNHQTHRKTPLHTRSTVAMHGTYGFELNPLLLSEEEKEEIRREADFYRKWNPLIREGEYYRLSDQPGSGAPFSAWMIVSPDRKQALISLVRLNMHSNGAELLLYPRGLNPDWIYEINGERHSGSVWMEAGIPLGFLEEYEALRLPVIRAEENGTD